MAERRIINGYIVERRDDGSIVTIGLANGPQPIQVAPGNPYAAPKAAAEVTDTQADANVNAATQGAQISSAQSDAVTKARTSQTAGLPEGWMWGPDGRTAVPIPGYSRQGISPEIRDKAIQAFSDADALDRAADEIERLYQQGPGATKGIQGLKDYLPTAGNKVFNDAGQQARGYVKRALGFTASEGNTASESSALYDPYLPSAGDRDEQIEAKIAKLRALAEDSRKKSAATLGGQPDQNGNITPWDQNSIRGETPQAAASGATEQSIPVNPQYQAKYSAFLQKWAQNPDPNAYVAERVALDREFGYGSDIESYAAWANSAADGLKRGGATLNETIPGVTVPLSGMQGALNSVANSAPGAAVVGTGDMLSFGALNAAAPDQMAALSDAQPVGMMTGQMLGAVGATAGMGAGGGATLGRLAPFLMRGGNAGALARGVGTDALYGGIYGGMTGDDPLSSAAGGAVGSLAGTAAGKGLGTIARGAKLSPAAEYLAGRNIPMTIGQKLGGMAKGIEDRLAGMPIVGDMVNARRLEGLNAFNREAFNEAGQRIGHTANDVGKEGVQNLMDAAGNAYDSATAGVSVPLDAQFLSDLQQIAAKGQQLPPDLRQKLALALENRLQPIADAGQMTGDGYQQAVRGMKSYRAENVKPGFEQDYRDILGETIDAMSGNMRRGGGSSVVEGLDNANSAYRSGKVLDDATNRAAGGSMSGENYIFTPSQLQRAGMASAKKFPGPQPFKELADAGQQVLPSKVPDSGTAGRLAQLALGGSLIGAGTGAGALAGGGEGAQTGGMTAALLTALLAAGGTKGGQRMLDLALVSRPDALKVTGEKIAKRAGLFGSATLPFTVTGY